MSIYIYHLPMVFPQWQCQEHTLLYDEFNLLCMLSTLLGIVFASIAVLLLHKTNKSKDVANRSLFWYFAATWLLGFVVYDVGMYTGKLESIFGNAPMAVLHAFGMFLLESDVSAIHDPFHNSWLYMAMFSVVHFVAACISMLFVIKHFGFNIIAAIKRFFEKSCLGKQKETTYIFWGMNDATYHLASSINKHHREYGGTYRIVVIRSQKDSESVSMRNGMERLFNFLSLRNKDLERLKRLDCLTTNSFVSVDNLNVNGQPVDVFGELGLKSVSKIISKKTVKDVHVFFLSDDETTNIEAVANLKRDKTIHEFIEHAETGNKKVTLYCHTRSNSIHRVIEDERPQNGIETRVVDSSRLCVDLLKHKPELQPVNYVDIEDDATVSSSFNALVVGFGQVGLDIVRFLYEFGAFVKSGSTRERVERSDFHCDVVDKNMPDLAGLFVANAPAIKPDMPFKGDNNKKSLITLHKMDCQSVYFYEKLESWIKELNYVVIATNDDVQNISLGVRILRLAIRYRADLKHFRILVRVRQDENRHFQNIAEFYNRLWEADLKKDDNDEMKRQKAISWDDPSSEPITLFGSMEEIYQYDYIVSDKLKMLSKKFKERYDRSIGASTPAEGNEDSWDREYRMYMQIDGEYAGYVPTFSNVMKLRRMQNQNFENCFHVHTKQRLAKCALGEDEYARLTDNQLFRDNNETSYHGESNTQPKEKVTRVLDTLAQTEHLRWNASHEILGYMEMGDEKLKDEARLLHGCLKDWQDLTTKIQSYDYNVVDVSLGINEREQKG